MKWKDEYATGIPRIDQQHKTLFRMAEEYREALDAGEGEKTYSVLLEFLDRYCRAHFDFEERCMEQYRCPIAHTNAAAHSEFIETLRGFQGRYATHGWRSDDARELVDTVDRWLDQHICKVDVQLRGYGPDSPPKGPTPLP